MHSLGHIFFKLVGIKSDRDLNSCVVFVLFKYSRKNVVQSTDDSTRSHKKKKKERDRDKERNKDKVSR